MLTSLGSACRKSWGCLVSESWAAQLGPCPPAYPQRFFYTSFTKGRRGHSPQ